MSGGAKRKGIDPAALMSPERPLDALLPGLGAAQKGVERRPLHPRVLEVEVEGEREWVFAGWQDPGGARMFHQHLRKLVEATFLHELSQPPSSGADMLGRRYARLRLMMFCDVEGLEQAVQAFGFRTRPWDEARHGASVGVLRDEAETVHGSLPSVPWSVWEAPIRHPQGRLGEQLLELQAMMSERMGDDVWGATPGGPSRLLSIYLRETFGEEIQPDLEGLDRMEFLLVQRETGCIRWIPPLLFQALADFVGVVLHTHFKCGVSWAVSEQEDDGMIPPPLFRITRGPQQTHLPIALHLLRWCMMPIQEGEEVPPLSAWLRDEFGGGR